MSDQSKHWEVYISKEKFNEIRSDPRLVVLLTLSRIVNSLNFCLLSLLEACDDDSPSSQRNYISSFLFACGVLYEGLRVARTLGKHFGDRESFRNGFGRLLKDKQTKELNDTVLNSMRNKLVFHYDEDVVVTTLSNLDLPSYAFVTGSGPKKDQIYYKLADEIAINFIIGNPGSKEEEEHIFRERLERITRVLVGFVRSADQLIPDVLKDMGWAGREKEA